MYRGKKILILGGASQHLKFVEAAKELGLYTVVTDYLHDSPCKRICDEVLMLNIYDVDGIVDYCLNNNIDGIVSGFLDPCQIPYAKICKKLGLFCYATPEQFQTFTNKRSFKNLCKKNGVNVISDYTETDVKERTIEFPVFVKPVDSRGSRGQSVCYSYEELVSAIKFAKAESEAGDCLIEKYFGDCDEIQITYFVIKGNIYIVRTADCNRGRSDLNLQKVVSCSISPSKYTDSYLEKAHSSVCTMIHDLGIENGPVFMQGFVKDGEFYFFDPGLRFPGVEFERIYKKIWDVDFARLLVQYSLSGVFPGIESLPLDGAKLKGNVAAVLFPVLRAGTILSIVGESNWKNNHSVVSYCVRYHVGDTLKWTFDVNQRYAEIDLLCSNVDELISSIESYYNEVIVKDINGKSMFFDKFNTNLLKECFSTQKFQKKNIEVLFIDDDDLLKAGCFNIPEAISITENAFKKRANNTVLFPDKISVVFDEKSQNRINCLPAGIVDDNVFGMKWISVFPNNPINYRKQNITAAILLSELQHGFPIAFMEGTLCSNLRTAATSAVAAKYLAKNNSQVIGFIGAGEQAKTHLMTFLHTFPSVKTCKVASRTIESEFIFINQMSRLYPEIQFIACDSCYEKAVRNSDIIISAISGQEKILQAEWLSKGAFYCHVAGLEDDFMVPKCADKIVCDDWDVVKHRTQTISLMYHLGLLTDDDIYGNLAEIVDGKLYGRESDEEIIYFDTVGMSFVDIMLANHMYKKVANAGLGHKIVLQHRSMFDSDKKYVIL